MGELTKDLPAPIRPKRRKQNERVSLRNMGEVPSDALTRLSP